MLVLVTGGRSYGNIAKVFEALEELKKAAAEAGEQFHVLNGGATGADAIARRYCQLRYVNCITVKVEAEEWERLGGAAGHARNQKMQIDREMLCKQLAGISAFHLYNKPEAQGILSEATRALQGGTR